MSCWGPQEGVRAGSQKEWCPTETLALCSAQPWPAPISIVFPPPPHPFLPAPPSRKAKYSGLRPASWANKGPETTLIRGKTTSGARTCKGLQVFQSYSANFHLQHDASLLLYSGRVYSQRSGSVFQLKVSMQMQLFLPLRATLEVQPFSMMWQTHTA